MPTLFRVSNDLYLCGSEGESAEYAASGGKKSISDEGRKALREKHGLGAWNVSGAFYGPSMAALDPMIQRVRRSFRPGQKATYIPHEEAAKDSAAAGRDQCVFRHSEHRANSAC